MRTFRRIRPAARAWVAILLAFFFLLGVAVPATAAPPPRRRVLSVKVSAPVSGSIVSGTVTVTAQVAGTPMSVRLTVDGSSSFGMQPAGSDTWSAAWNTANTTDGEHTLQVTATDPAGIVTQASTRVTVNNGAMKMRVLTPAAGAAVSGQVALQAVVSSTGPVTSVAFATGYGAAWVPMTFNATLGQWEGLWDASSLRPDQNVTLYFRAVDESGNTAVATRAVTIARAPQPSGDWTHARGDLQGRAYTAQSYGTNFTPKWTLSTTIHSGRLVHYNGILYSASTTSPGYLSGLNAATGSLIFDLRLESTVTPASAGPHGAYVGIWNTAVLAVRPDGTTLWRSSVAAASAPLVTPAGVLVGDRYGKVYALNPQTGEALWSVQTTATSGFAKDTVPVYADGRLYLPASSSVHVIDVANRQVAFTISTSTGRGLLYDYGWLYVATGSSVRAYDGATGQLKWTFTGGGGSAPAIANGILIVGTDESEPKLKALNAETGALLWSAVLDTYGSAYGSPMIAGDLVYMGAYFGGLKVFNLHTGQYLTTLLPDAEARNTPIPVGDTLYLADGQWGAYALKKQ